MKPKVICYMMSSVDGRLNPERYTELFDGESKDKIAVFYFQEGTKMNADAVIIGRMTFQMHYMPQIYNNDKKTTVKQFKNYIAPQKSGDTIIVTDRRGKIFYERTSETIDNNYIAILGENVSEEYLHHLRKNDVSYLFAGLDGNDFKQALDVLGKDFNMKKILLEGGAILSGTFLKAKLIDELSLMIYPGVDGLTGISSIFEISGDKNERPAEGQTMELLTVERLTSGIVWLTYKFHKTK